MGAPWLTFACFLSFSLLVTNSYSMRVQSKLQNLQDVKQSARAITLPKEGDYCEDIGNVPSEEVTWNPVLIQDNVALNNLCAGMAGTFPNPCNCSQFIMCAWGYPFLASCADPDETAYLPFDSLCGYAKNSECPSWPSVWKGDGDKTCTGIGQRQWDPPFYIPAQPEENCGQEYMDCANFTQVDALTCAPGRGFSKAYFGCLDLWLCELADKFFGLWNM